ncbi:hypothetical protein NSP_32770 [Nodularia spumigena CCY9414]|nr:hypothetical protein NSP_32770 [Nodularia spumigena CCY9414]
MERLYIICNQMSIGHWEVTVFSPQHPAPSPPASLNSCTIEKFLNCFISEATQGSIF